MIKNPRQADILNILEQYAYASVELLAKLTYASEPTIRRDLIYLESKGYIIRNHGGATLPLKGTSVRPVAVRNSFNLRQKKSLCKEAAKLIQESMTIFLDASTTASFIVEYLPKNKDLTVITNSLQTCNKLNELNLKFFCTGGDITNQICFTGTHAERFIRAFNADICFFSSTTISSEGIISDNGEKESATTFTMLEQSKRRVYLCDDSKIDLPAKYNLTTVNNIDKIYTTAKENSLLIPKEKVVYVPIT